jgi:serine/threonine-protein kinase RsbW
MTLPLPYRARLYRSAASSGRAAGAAAEFTTSLPASSTAVREAMIELRGRMRQWGLAEELAARVELVAAEICNNIAEHGFAGEATGSLCLHVSSVPPDMLLQITDHGAKPPAQLLERPRLPALDVARADLPEGGFGWFLVQSEADVVQYERDKGMNRYCLRFTPRDQ